MSYHINDLQSAFEKLYSCNFNNNYATHCVFRQEKTRSLFLDDKKKSKPYYKCFGCGETGDIWDLYSKYYNVEFKECARLVKQDFGIDPPIEIKNSKIEKSRSDMHDEAARKFASNKKLIHVKGYYYSNTNYKHRFKDSNGNKTFIHTYFDSDKNKIVFKDCDLNEHDRNLISKIYNKSKIDYAISHNLDFYICEGEKDVDNISKLGFCACHIETGKEEELNTMLKNTIDFKGRIFHVYDNEISRVGINKARKRAASINHDKQYLIEPTEKDISDDIEIYEVETVKRNINLQSNVIKTLAFSDEERAYECYSNEKTGKRSLIANIKNIEQFLDINLNATLCIDCITKNSLIVYEGGSIEANNDRARSYPYLMISAISDMLNSRIGVPQIKNMIDDIWNKRYVNLFEINLRKYKTNSGNEFNRLMNDFYNAIDKKFTSKEVFEELFTFFFTRTVRRAIDYGKRPNQCLKMIFTIIGFQSCGKSRFVENIFYDMEMYDFVKAGATLGRLSRDDIMIVTSAPIIELAETTSLLRSAKYSEDLKRFISQSSDCYRAPYARASTTHPRISSYIYTTNQELILRDKTGNTRFYTIKAVKEIPNPANYNMKDVWGYIYNLAKNVSVDELKDYYNIPEILKKYISESSDKLFDTSHYVDELFNLSSEDDINMLYTKTELEDILQIKDRKSKLDFHSSLEIKGVKYKVHRMGVNPKTGINRTLKGYKLNALTRFKNYGEPFYN